MTKSELVDQVADRAAEAVEGRDNHDVDLAGPHLGQEPVEGGPPLPGTRDALVDEFDRPPAPGRHVLPEVAELRLAVLVHGAHPRVDGHPFRRRGLRQERLGWQGSGHTLDCIYM